MNHLSFSCRIYYMSYGLLEKYVITILFSFRSLKIVIVLYNETKNAKQNVKNVNENKNG